MEQSAIQGLFIEDIMEPVRQKEKAENTMRLVDPVEERPGQCLLQTDEIDEIM